MLEALCFKGRITGLLVFASTLLSMLLVVQLALATAPPKQIIVQTNRSGNAEIYSMDMDGGNATDLTNNSGYDGQPNWSATADKIAFVSDRNGGNYLYTMDPGGGNVTQANSTNTGYPAWSPDGTKIAYASNGHLRVLDINSSSVTSNDHQVGYDNNISHPTWSPDGTNIAYANYVGSGESDIEYISSTGTSTTASTTLTTSSYPNHWYDQAPSWGHDGTIAFVSNRDGSTDNIFTIKLGGSMTDITNDTSGTDNTIPSWAPGGGVIYYSHKPSGTSTYSVQMITEDGQVKQSISTGESDVVVIQQAPLPGVPSTGAHYVALGDSVAAGEGINYGWTWSTGSPFGSWSGGNTNPGWMSDPYSSDNQKCHQSLSAYPTLVRQDLSITTSTFWDFACTGASAANGVLGTQSGITSTPQLGYSGTGFGSPNTDYDSDLPDIVTLTVGADDVDFAGFLAACYQITSDVSCNGTGGASDAASRLSIEKTNLQYVLSEIHDRGVADGKIPLVIVTDYANVFPSTYSSGCPDIGPSLAAIISETDMHWLQAELDNLNRNIMDVASTFDNVVFVPIGHLLDDHGFCSADPWLYGLSLQTSDDWFGNGNPASTHPTEVGQQKIADQIEAVTG